MEFDYFLMFEYEDRISSKKEIGCGWGKIRRKVRYTNGKPLEIRFYGGEEGISDDPKHFLYQFEVKSLEYLPENKTILLVAQQEVYDFSLENFVENEIAYTFNYARPVY